MISYVDVGSLNRGLVRFPPSCKATYMRDVTVLRCVASLHHMYNLTTTDGMSCYVISCDIMPCNALPYHAMSQHARRGQAMSGHDAFWDVWIAFTCVLIQVRVSTCLMTLYSAGWKLDVLQCLGLQICTLYMYIHIYIYIYTHIYIYTYTYIRIHIYIYIYV